MNVERGLSDLLSEFARRLLSDFSIQENLDHLMASIVGVLPVSGAGVSLICPGTVPSYVSASDDDALYCELLQSGLNQGPCLAAYASGEAVAIPDLAGDGRFPEFSAPALAAGLAAVFTFPLRDRDGQLGALDLYSTTAGPLPPREMEIAQTLADVTAAYLIDARARAELRAAVADTREARGRTEQGARSLRASEARNTAILASTLDAVITMDEDGRIVEFNEAAVRTFGYAPEEVHGRDLADLILLPEQREDHRRELAHYRATGDGGPLLVPRTERTFLRADGSRFPAEVSIHAVGSPGRRFLTRFVRDLTEQRLAEGERRALEERVRQAERLDSLGQLAGSVAHDFNNLLMIIQGFAELIAEARTDGDAVEGHAQQIIGAAERATRLTQQLLTFARHEPICYAALDLAIVVTDLHDLLAQTVGEHVRLVVAPSAGLPPVQADRGQVDQVLLNLAVNARDAMAEGGTLTIETSLVHLGERDCWLHPGVVPGVFVQLSVTDTGLGMSGDVAAHAFDPFFTTKTAGTGCGLGLATVHGIITKAGGTLTLRTAPGSGTTVTALFPVVDDAETSGVIVGPGATSR